MKAVGGGNGVNGGGTMGVGNSAGKCALARGKWPSREEVGEGTFGDAYWLELEV